MDPVAEPEVRPVAAADVEYVGSREPDRIAVSRAQAHQHLFVRGDLHPVESDRLGRHPERGMRDRGGEADELVDRGGKLPGIGQQRLELADAKRHSPADDLVSVLVAAEDEALTTQELLSSLFQLVVAGHDTTASLIGNSVVALLDHPGQLHELLTDPGRLPAAVDELIRFTAPVPHATFRVTTEPVTLAGAHIPAGEQVLVCLAAANRDPARFPAPDVLDIGREDGPNLGLGHGIHYCLGAPLARLEAKVAFEELLGRHPGLRLAVDRDALAWAHGDGLVLRGLVSLPVVLGPARRRG